MKKGNIAGEAFLLFGALPHLSEGIISFTETPV